MRELNAKLGLADAGRPNNNRQFARQQSTAEHVVKAGNSGLESLGHRFFLR
jgi:hypothetical protein